MRSESRVTFGPGEGREIGFGPNQLRVKIDVQTGAQQLMVLESTFPPDAGGPLHLHRSFEEAFYVLEGEIEYRVGESRVRATPGATIFIPPEAPHAFRNVGSGPARHIAIASDPRGAQMIEELGQASPEKYGEILARYDSVPVLENSSR